MSNFYANITLRGPASNDVIAYLNAQGDMAYVSPGGKSATIVFHEDFAEQENLAARLSAMFSCPALLVMGFGESVLLYHLYENGERTDAYVSTPHADLQLEEPVPLGDAKILCAAFESDRFERRVDSILRKEGKPDQPYSYAINRHGELARALGLPVFAAGASYASIDVGELPEGAGFDSKELVQTKSHR